ncbi:hypothetical protein CBER1_08222 [Cercospora berteroae]|uniref:RNI-like protein n=1 Tax=Cercospora berteroae TaxID=357750 RepID=A0A2S6CGE1_9PEZI|nr:hypothetical protein CBER1_08222 [Cercospora berteroae]
MASPTESVSSLEGTESRSKRWADRIARQGPWQPLPDPLSYAGPPSLPMPVQISDKASLAPFFEYLRGNAAGEKPEVAHEPGHEEVELLEFSKGVAYNDGRIDLCKMVTGPPNIGDLMNATRSYTSGRHFLLGNNIIGPQGAREIARFIDERPDQYETWYLAGNCIDKRGLEALVDAMIKSRVITNVWLKRNPLGVNSAAALARLCTRSPVLRTLDLDQTNLGNEGVAKFFALLNRHEKPIALRHVYLNASGIGAEALTEISEYLKHSELESLYLSCNPIGEAVALLADGVKESQALQRLALQSCGLTGPTTANLLDAIKGHPTLQTVDIGQSYATEDLNLRFNWLEGEEFATSLQDLITCSKGMGLRYLNIGYTPMTCEDLLNICEAVISNSTLVWFKASPLVKGGKSRAEVKAGLHLKKSMNAVRELLAKNVAEQYPGMTYEEFHNGPKRFLLSPPDVRYIDSVYRNRDAGMARRGLKVLDKWWEEGDETLRLVHEDGVEL